MKLIDSKAYNNPLISAQHESVVSLNKVFAVVGMWLDHRNKFWHVVVSKDAQREILLSFSPFFNFATNFYS